MVLAIIFSAVQKISRSVAEKLKLWILNALLWGGALLLALEHIWHGEVTLWPPFLTAMANPADVPVMLYEMATIGTAISAVTVAVWGIILASIYYRLKAVAGAETIKKQFTVAKP